jgi:hypothetical protein
MPLEDDRTYALVWEFTRADGFVLSCDVLRHTRDWILTLACDGAVFARTVFASRQEAEAWAETCLTGMRLSQRPAVNSDTRGDELGSSGAHRRSFHHRRGGVVAT